MNIENHILNKLYKKYYINKKISYETSSFWMNLSDSQIVTKTSNKFELSGYGFGEFIKNTFFNNLKNIPSKLFIKKLLWNCDYQIIKDVRWIAKNSSRLFSYDLARQALILDKLKSELKNLEEKTFCIIGDGYGVLGCLIKKHFPKSKIISVNLGRILLFDVYYSQLLFSDLKHSLIDLNQNLLLSDFNYIEAEKYMQLKFNADIFINVCSMGEMDPKDIKNYFKSMREQKNETFFYSCNRISKKLNDGQIIKFSDYPWHKDDTIIFDELCPWHQKYPKNKPPFICKFDGPIQHRLVNIHLKEKN